MGITIVNNDEEEELISWLIMGENYFRNKITFLVRIRKWIANRGASVKLGRKGV